MFTTPHFGKGDKVSLVTTNIFLRGHTNWKLKDTQLGTLSLEEQTGKHIYIMKFLARVRVHNVFHVNNLRPCSTAPLRPMVVVVVPEGDDE
jgi:hypothetical protein